MGNYDEMTTARLTWVVLDRLVPPDDEPAARAALIARDRDLAVQVATGALSEDEAIETLRRHGHYGPVGDPAVVRLLAVLVVALLILAGLAVALLH